MKLCTASGDGWRCERSMYLQGSLCSPLSAERTEEAFNTDSSASECIPEDGVLLLTL